MRARDSVVGYQSVLRAAQAGAVDTLLLEPDQHSPGEPALLKACTLSGAEAGLVSSETELSDGVGALLRYPLKG